MVWMVIDGYEEGGACGGENFRLLGIFGEEPHKCWVVVFVVFVVFSVKYR
jgi:hypothetical protein